VKKVVATILCLLMAIGTLAGCNKGAGTTTSGEKPTLRFLNQDNGTDFDPNNYPTQKMLEQKTGYKVQYEALPAENADDKLNLLMSNKEAYDILKLTPAQFTKLAQEGALEPLDDLLKKYGQTVTKVTAAETFVGGKVDGKTYGIPEKNAKDTIGTALTIRQGLLDELGLKVPTTTDEFYTFLKAIKDKKNIVPFSMYNTQAIVTEIAGAFGISTQWEDVNGKLQFRGEDAGMKDYLAYMNKLYKDGLIDQEMPANTAAKVQEKFTSGKAAVIEYAWWSATSLIPAMQKTFPNEKLVLIPPLKGPDGKSSNIVSRGVSYYIAIPKVAKHKEDAMKWINAKLQPDTFKSLAIGDENVDYTVKNGEYYPILPAFMNDRGHADWYLTGTDQEAYAKLWLVRVRKDTNLEWAFNEIQKQMTVGKADPTSFAPPLPNSSKNGQKLGKLETDSLIKFIAGADKIDNYSKYLDQWKSQGGTDVEKEINDWYAKNKK
jgi:ABC-type sugar transport system, periplasmic component